MNKIIGYILAAVGVLLAVVSFKQVRDLIKIPFPSSIPEVYVMIAGAVIAIIGVYLIAGKGGLSSKKEVEVPILQDKKVVGFRRIKQ
jgi:sulfite exporter TauE/SafE